MRSLICSMEDEIMAKKTIMDEVYGKITFKEGYWSREQKIEMTIGGKVDYRR